MEIDIQSKTDNPLLKRIEVYFKIHHEGEKTPKREFVRSELSEKLNIKKENILVSFMKSSFGSTDTIGFAKVYKSVKDAKSAEKNHILKRNNIIVDEKKPDTKKEEKPSEEKPEVEKPSEKKVEDKVEEKTEKEVEKPVEDKTEEIKKPEEKEPADEKKLDQEKKLNEEKPSKEDKSKEIEDKKGEEKTS